MSDIDTNSVTCIIKPTDQLMRIAWNEKEVRERFILVPEKARSAVHHNCMLIEKFIDEPRHIDQNMGECVCMYVCVVHVLVCVCLQLLNHQSALPRC